MNKQEDVDKIDLEIRGMTCDSCAIHVTKALRSTDGVLEVNLPGWASGRASIIAVKSADDNELVKAVVKAGYRASILSRRGFESQLSTIDLDEETDLDLLVIGSGGAGMAAAIKAAELGYTSCIVEAGTIGGTCVNIGCIPSKTLISAAKLYHLACHHNFAGVVTKAEHIDWKTVISQKDELVRELRQSKYLDVLTAYEDKISLISGWAEIQPDGIVKISNGQTCKPKKIIIATGAKPKILPLEGIEDVEVLTSTSLMALEKQPKTLLIIGGRAVALELGQVMARFGTKVTILQRSSQYNP